MAFIGHGKNTVGGAGGTSYVVTTLNPTGAGSLGEAISASGARIITFAVAGNIESGYSISNDNITIDGSTAPLGGICIKGNLNISASEVIIQHARIRLGDGGYKDINGNVVGAGGSDLDTILIQTNNGGTTQNIVIDHCSVSWSIDEVLSSFGGSGLINNISITNCIISHGLNASHHGDGSHSMGSLFNYNTRNISVLKCLYFGNGERHIRMGAGVTCEFHNNIVYGFKAAMVVGFGTKIDAGGNAYYQGNYDLNTTQDDLFTLVSSGASAEPGVTYVNTDSDIWLSDNWTNAVYPPNSLPTSTGTEGYTNGVSANRLVDSGYVILDRPTARTQILADVGARLPRLDSYDTQLISDVENDVLANLIDTQLQVGDFPDLTTGAVGNTPQITRTDNNPTTIILGGNYIPPTGTWTDVEDGSGTATVGGDTVDVNTIGVYNVTLFHTDTDSNTGIISIPITVQAAQGGNINYDISNKQRNNGKQFLKKLIKR